MKLELLDFKNIAKYSNILFRNIDDCQYFEHLGWNKNQIYTQIKKNNNYSLGLKQSNQLIGFIIGNLIYIEKLLEYEILLIYVDKKFRKMGHASFLIHALTKSSYLKTLDKITL